MNVLVTGGAGYIGSHAALFLVENGYQVVVLDNLCNSSSESIRRVEKITGKKVELVVADARNYDDVKSVFEKWGFDYVLHFAGLKSVNESISKPALYYEANVASLLNICRCMEEFKVYNLVFSSSATVYGQPQENPIKEDHPSNRAVVPYGKSKAIVEEILYDMGSSSEKWAIALLRYFNPVGAHESGLIGEDPSTVPNNLMPYVAQVAIGRLECLSVFGDDYNTVDGTGVRDYIHVMDLVEGHVAAMEKLKESSGVRAWNLGTGKGCSVLELVQAFEEENGVSVPYKISPRRSGDVAECYADPTLAKQNLNWVARRNIFDMVRDSWNWQKNNPYGYSS